MKKRILSLVLCAAMLLSMCLFLGAGVVDDASDAPAESTAAAQVQAPQTVVYTAAGPFLPAVSVQPVLRAVRASGANELKDGLNLSKTATANADGSYKIRMEAFTTGKVTTTTSTTPVDVVLVLDQSGSMAYNFDGNETRTDSARRQYAMKQAVNTFIEAVADKYNAEKSDHRIAVVTFGTNASTLMDWTLVTPAKTDTAESPSGETALKAKINGLPREPEGATNVADGMKKAETLMGSGYNYTGSNTTRQKVVVVFTDGVPTTESDFSTTVANAAIQSAKVLKGSGATVYSVGIFNGANPEQLYGDKGFDRNSNGSVGSDWSDFSFWMIGDIKSYDVPAGNRFLNYISSNYSEASEIGIKNYKRTFLGVGYRGWEITRNFNRTSSSYYLTANDSASLNQIFTTISENIGQASIDLSSSTVVKDIVTPYFTMPANTADVKLYTADYNGASFGAEQAADSDVRATIDANANTVSVTGFDFNKYYVADKQHEGTYGKKLIIEFDVSVADGFLGGNQVPTNDGQSGIYAKGTMIKAFDVPTQDVEVKSITPMADPETIYLGDSANLQELVHQNATFDGTNNAFVDVTYTVEDEKGTVVGTYTVPAGSSSGTWVWSDAASGGTVAPEQTTTYKVTCTVSPTQVGTQQAVSSEPVPFTITVNTCSLTISKKVTGQNNGQSFVFTVKDTNGNVITTVAVKGGASKTITGLPIGTYTVTEDTQWSWQYDLTSGNGVKKELKANAAEDHATAEFTNAYKGTNWLTSIADVINKWLSADDVQQFPGKN